MSRAEKIAKLKQTKARKAPETLGDYATLADAMEAIIADFKLSMKKGVDINDLDVLIDRLDGIGELKASVDELKNAVASFPALPEEVKIASVNEFLTALSEIKIQVPDIIVPEQKEINVPDYTGAVKKMADALVQMAISVKANAPKPSSQRAADYVPYRRVIKKGNSWVFDDNPTPQAGPAGGGGTPLVQADDGSAAVPVANADGSPIGSGTGSATEAKQDTQITEAQSTNTKLDALSKAEDTAHSTGDKGIQGLGVRNDATTQTSLSGTVGDYTPFATDQYGNSIVEQKVLSVGYSDNASNTQSVPLGHNGQPLNHFTYPFYFDGTTWDRVRGDAINGALVNLGANNDVTVAGVATSANQTTANSTLANIETYLQNRYGGGKTSVPFTVTASGDTTIHTPASGQAIRLFSVDALTDPDELLTPLIKVLIGTTEKLRGHALGKWEIFEGAADEVLKINLSAASSVSGMVVLEEFTP